MPRQRVLLRRGVAAAALIVLFVVLVRQGESDWRALPRDAFHLTPWALGASWLVQTVGWVIVVLNWRRILAAVGADPRPLATHFEFHSWSGLGNVVPGSVWLPASRVALYRRAGVSGVAVSAAVFVEWLLVGVAGLALYLVAAPWAASFSGRELAVLAVAAAVALAVLHPAVQRRLLELARRRIGFGGDALARGTSLGVGGTVVMLLREVAVLALSGVGFYFLMVAIAPQASVPDALAASALSVAVANLLAWVPATLVFRDGAMVVALLPLYGTPIVALGVVVAWRLWMTGVLLSWALIASSVRRTRGDTTQPGG